MYQVNDDKGAPLDAHFDLDGGEVVFHSRGGTKGAASSRNTDYGLALRLVLDRIIKSGVSIERISVDSTRTRHLPVEARTIFTSQDSQTDALAVFGVLSSRMKEVGRAVTARPSGGNSTKALRLTLASQVQQGELVKLLGARPVKPRNRARIPAREFAAVTAEHIRLAVDDLLDGFTDHPFHESTYYDLLVDGEDRLDPKAVFGLAATRALGFQVLPEHFNGGLGTTCFLALDAAGYDIVPKGHPWPKLDVVPSSVEDLEFLEGSRRLIQHLKAERSRGLARAKKAEFQRVHGRLFCERCGVEPAVIYGLPHGDACIEVHHNDKAIGDMEGEHATKLSEVQCLCANCHRVVHSEIRASKRRSTSC